MKKNPTVTISYTHCQALIAIMMAICSGVNDNTRRVMVVMMVKVVVMMMKMTMATI